MPQVFVSYARTDKRHVQPLVSALRQAGFQPWWDEDIPAGASWEDTIENALTAADAVIVCWSPRSVASENVRSEARAARSHGRLVQAFIAPCEPPLFFGERQGIDLTKWKGAASAPEIKLLSRALEIAGAASSKATAPHRSSKSARKRMAATSFGAALLAISLGLIGWHLFATPAHAAAKIAIVPLEGLGDRASTGSLAAGATDQIRASLDGALIPTISRLDSENLSVGDVDGKLRQLGVGYTVSGTIQAVGSSLHARVHLDDSVRHASLWAYEVNGSVKDPVALDTAIGRAIAGVVSCAYRGLGPGGLTDAELLSRYLRVCDLFVNNNNASSPKDTDELVADLRMITAKAPNFAPAHSDLAKFSAYLAPLMAPEQAASARAEATREATRALDLDSHSADAWLAREMILPPTHWAQREALLRKGVAANPDWPHTNGFLAEFLEETGRMREASVYAQRAAAADLQIDWRPVAAAIACAAGDASETIADIRQRLSLSPGDQHLKTVLRWCLDDLRDYRGEKALETPAAAGAVDISAYRQAVEDALISGKSRDRVRAQELALKIERSPAGDKPLAKLSLLEFSAALGDLDNAFRLTRTYTPGYPLTGQTYIFFLPAAEGMRRDPRFLDFVKRVGLQDYWRSSGHWPDFCSGPNLNLAVCQRSVSGR